MSEFRNQEFSAAQRLLWSKLGGDNEQDSQRVWFASMQSIHVITKLSQRAAQPSNAL